ncbi:metallophosphoesterase [Tropicimonas sp. IMCC34043]|uniref:metallophosphoesterase n=1 Tax=Tropicimonas sp. IMCC34043 TaxID=2248760 RepID=UPI000E21D96B|nr:metallophosphoesterase [Tropicimonas sp. IMCC34043]
MRIYAIGDVHGHVDKLQAAHELIARDQAECGGGGETVVHCGDYVDRGPDSRGVLDHLLACRSAGLPHVMLLGNHDEMLLRFLTMEPGDRAAFETAAWWLTPPLGGRRTLASYGVKVSNWLPLRWIRKQADKAVPAAHLDFLESLGTSHSEAGCYFCHAGIRPGVPFAEQEKQDLIWIREPFLTDPRDHGALIVHGHTPVEQVTDYGNRLNLDTGAGYGRPVSAVAIEDGTPWLLTDEGRLPVHQVTY